MNWAKHYLGKIQLHMQFRFCQFRFCQVRFCQFRFCQARFWRIATFQSGYNADPGGAAAV